MSLNYKSSWSDRITEALIWVSFTVLGLLAGIAIVVFYFAIRIGLFLGGALIVLYFAWPFMSDWLIVRLALTQ